MINAFEWCKNLLGKMQSFVILLIRLLLAYGFFQPALLKWQDISSVAIWFGELGIPFAKLQAYLAAGTEAAGVVLLSLGLGSRLISFPLLITMLVAIKTVHWVNGFESGNNGFEIPFHYSVFLLTIIAYGPGKYSLDALIEKKFFIRKGSSDV